MKAGELVVSIRADLGVLPAMLDCLGEILDPNTGRLERAIEISALRALQEIQQLGDTARRELGLRGPDEVFGLRLEVAP